MTPAMGGPVAGEAGAEHPPAVSHANDHDRDAARRDDHTPGHHDHDEHCPACALAKAMALPTAASPPTLAALRLVQAAPRPDRAAPRRIAGPPVGLRAPPLTV